MNEFDKIIASKLSSDDYPINEGMWQAIESQLAAPSVPAQGGGLKASFWSGVAATTLLVSVMNLAPGSVEHNTVPAAFEQTEVTAVEDNTSFENVQAVESTTSTAHIPQRSHEIALKSADLNRADIESGLVLKKIVPVSSKEDSETQEEPSSELMVSSSVQELTIRANGIECPGSEVTFSVAEGQSGTFRWVIDGVYVIEGSQAKHTFQESGSHEVLLLAETENGPIRTKRVIDIYENPMSQATAVVGSHANCFAQPVQLHATPGGQTYKWTTSKVNAQGANANLMLPRGEYDIVLQTINEHGCTSTQNVFVRVESGLEVFAPNSFSPNNDGKNDTWAPVGLERCAAHSVQVFRARDNALVFETTNAEAWNGSLNGVTERLQRGETFLYRIQMTDDCGTEKEMSGRITVVQ